MAAIPPSNKNKIDLHKTFTKDNNIVHMMKSVVQSTADAFKAREEAFINCPPPIKPSNFTEKRLSSGAIIWVLTNVDDLAPLLE
jgi:hypothetical protein